MTITISVVLVNIFIRPHFSLSLYLRFCDNRLPDRRPAEDESETLCEILCIIDFQCPLAGITYNAQRSGGDVGSLMIVIEAYMVELVKWAKKIPGTATACSSW